MMLLGKQQRAMLAEMGIRVWQPEPVPAIAEGSASVASAQNKVAINTVAGSAVNIKSAVPFDAQKQAIKTPALPVATQGASHADTWRVGALQTLYGNPAADAPSRWLLLLEQPEAALQNDFDAMAGDAGKLLDNMLRAAKLHTTAVVMLAPLVRSLQTGNNLASQLTDVLANVLEDALEEANANVVLVMGRLAAQALLQSTEPLAKLRGRLHDVHGQQTVITLDPAYLLRNPLDKAKAWDDLCLALQAVASTSD